MAEQYFASPAPAHPPPPPGQAGHYSTYNNNSNNRIQALTLDSRYPRPANLDYPPPPNPSSTMSPSQLSIPTDPAIHNAMPHFGHHPTNPYAFAQPPQPVPISPTNPRKRRLSGDTIGMQPPLSASSSATSGYPKPESPLLNRFDLDVQGQPPQMQQPPPPPAPPAKKSRVNTPWTPAEEQRLKQMRDAGNSWSEIAKSFPNRTEGSVKKHWYKDMHYAEFAEDESVTLLNAIREYEASKWKVIGAKVGKPAKACEQYAKEHFTKEQMAGKVKESSAGKDVG